MASPIVDLSKIDWGNHVPSTDGNIDGADLHNLSDIAKSALSSNPEIQKKCWNFATVQNTGAKTYGAGKILKESNVKAKQETVTFFNGEKQKVDLYKLAALKKDYPNFTTEMLNEINLEQFDEMILFLYEGTESKNAPTYMSTIGIEDYALKVKNNELTPDLVKNCPLDKLPQMLQALMDKYEKIPEESGDYYKVKDSLSAFSKRIKALDPKNREHIKTGAELYKVLNTKNQILGFVNLGDDNYLKKQTENLLSVSAETSKDRGLFSSMVQSLATFFSDSFIQWFDVDKEFIMNTLRGVSDLKMTISREIPESMIDELHSLENLTELTLSAALSAEYKQMVTSKGFPSVVIPYR